MARKSKEERALERERQRQAAVDSVDAALERDSSRVDDPFIQEVRAAGLSLFPLIPADIRRGLDVEWERKGIDFDPKHHFVKGLIADGTADTVYWTPERRAAAANEVAMRMACGESVRAILGPGRDRSMLPSESCFYRWIFGIGDEYVMQCYMLGRQMRAERYSDELVELADGSKGAADMAQVSGFRLAIETRQWIMERILPKLYGRKGDGQAGLTINVNTNLDGQQRDDSDGAYRATVEIGASR